MIARVVTVLAVGLVSAACGTAASTSENPTGAAPATQPTTTAPSSGPSVSATPAPPATSTSSEPPPSHVVVDARGVEVAIESVDRVIPLDGEVAEVVFALGMGDRVVATDLSATYPPEADALPQIGYQRALSTEPILAFEPTLLIATDLAGPPETIDDLEQVGIPLVIVPDEPTATGAADKIRAIADALGVPARGEELATQVQQEIDQAIAARDDSGPAPRVVSLYVRGASTQVVLGEEFSLHWLVEAAGGDDISDELGVTESAPISAEALLAAAPDVILLPASGLQSVGGVAGLLESVPALAETPAGRAGAVLAYDDQLMLGNGPRTAGFLRTLIDDLDQYRPPEPAGAQP